MDRCALLSTTVMFVIVLAASCTSTSTSRWTEASPQLAALIRDQEIQVWEALKNSVGDTFVVRHDVPSIFDGHYDPSFTLDLCCKDLRLLKALGEQTRTQMDLTLLARAKFEEARTQFGGSAAELLVCKLVENASETDLRVEGNWTKHWEV